MGLKILKTVAVILAIVYTILMTAAVIAVVRVYANI